jgi:hypothetical protein
MDVVESPPWVEKLKTHPSFSGGIVFGLATVAMDFGLSRLPYFDLREVPWLKKNKTTARRSSLTN